MGVRLSGAGAPPSPTVSYPVDFSYPQTKRLADAGALELNGTYTHHPIAAIAMLDATLGAATHETAVRKGMVGSRWTCNATPQSSENTFQLPMQARLTKLPDGVKLSDRYRLFWYSFLWLADVVANYTDQSGFALEATGSIAPGWIRGSANGAMGVVGDGAGGWRWVSKQFGLGAGLYTESVPLVWPAVADLTRVDLVILAATQNRDAIFRLYLNGGIAIERHWGAGSVLPDYTAVGTNAFTLHVRAADNLVGSLWLGDMRFRAGAFDIDGSEILV